jgi:LmbE family N-acetylglucosaminyl deacetylase
MIALTALLPADRAPHVLCLGAHSDDIEIGCAGTLMRIMAERPETELTWVVLSASGDRRREARESAEELLSGAATSSVRIESFRDGFFPWEGAEIKTCFEEIASTVSPDLIFTHCEGDAHQDHRLVRDLTWNTFRDHQILEYEIPKYDGDLGTPDLLVRLDEETCVRKVEHLMRHFRSQADRHWFTDDTFFAVLRLRGVESGPASRYAEGFYCRKLAVG